MPIPAIDRPRALSDTLLVMVFLAAICLPAADVFFALEPTRLSEKRRRAPPPPVRLSQPLEVSYPAAFESWWNDNFGFRRSLVVGYSRALLALGVSPTPSVILGRSGWLFFAGDEALASYRAVQPFTEVELAAWQRRIETRRDWLAERGIRYLVVIAPNKETIYPEFMPESLNRVRPVTRLDQLVAHLRAHSSVAVVDPRDALRTAKAGGILYLRTDTHWNDVGAWLLYREIVTGLRRLAAQFRRRPRRARASCRGHPGDRGALRGGTDRTAGSRPRRSLNAPRPPNLSGAVVGRADYGRLAGGSKRSRCEAAPEGRTRGVLSVR